MEKLLELGIYLKHVELILKQYHKAGIFAVLKDQHYKLESYKCHLIYTDF